MQCINYAHRGASEQYPENTLFAFYMGLTMGADGIETDIQRTKDGVLVLFHDDTMDRLLGVQGAIADYTYDELLRMDFGAYKGEAFKGEKIVTLEEFLRHFGEKPLTFALEIKQMGVERDMLQMVDRFGLRAKVIFTSFSWENMETVRALDQTIRLGYLTETVTPDLLKRMEALSIKQVCPRIGSFDDEMFTLARQMGFSIRFWGINSDQKMRAAMKSGADGMTINNPAALTAALQ
ncbi:MAG: glycerophosphodiester phosphodiesterase family protein, partial [Clostridia bacterium]